MDFSFLFDTKFSTGALYFPLQISFLRKTNKNTTHYKKCTKSGRKAVPQCEIQTNRILSEFLLFIRQLHSLFSIN